MVDANAQVLRPRKAGAVQEEMLRLEVKLLNGSDLLLELVRGPGPPAYRMHACQCVPHARSESLSYPHTARCAWSPNFRHLQGYFHHVWPWLLPCGS